MPITRRQFTRVSAVALASATCAGPLVGRLMAQEPTPVNWRRLSRKARVVEGMGGNALVFVDGDGTLLVDTKIASVGELTRGFIETADYKITQIVNTHHHADHTGGNFAWSADTPILAHEIARNRVLEQHSLYVSSQKRDDPNATTPDIESFAPSHTTPGDTEITIGDQKIILRHFGPGHTDNDLAVHIPGENILHAGDLLFHKTHIYVDLKGGVSTKHWMANVDELIKLCDNRTTVIPGHGPVTNVRGLEKQRDYIRALREVVTDAIKAGKTREETYRLPLPGTENYDPPKGLAYALSAVYKEMTGETD